MKTHLQKLVLAAVLASSVPAAALARDCDHDFDRDFDRDGRPPAQAPYAPPTGYVPPAGYAPAYPTWPAPAPARWREARWRERELARLRFEFRALEDERARFYALNGNRPGKVRRFERWYAARRAELEARWSEVAVVAWR